MPPLEDGIEDVPGGRLQLFQEAWEDAPASTQAIIKRGFHWEWISTPPALTMPKLVAGAPDLGEEVSKLLQKGAIYQVPLQPCFSANLFSVPKATGGSRPIIDLSRLNKFIMAPQFTMTNHNTLRKLITEAAWGASLDLQDAYLHVPIRKNLHKFMAFSHGHQLYFFKVLPFGLNVAPMIFTKILKHPLSRLHQEGIPVLAYLDDWITWAPNKIILQINLRKILSTLEGLGFLVNYEKSQLAPASDLTWLGVRWFLQSGLWDVPSSFKDKISSEANQLLHARVISRRKWESFMGKLAFLGQIHKHFSSGSPSIPSPGQAQGQEGSTPRSSQREPQALDLTSSSPRSNALPSAPTQDRPLDRCVFIWLGSTLRRGSFLPRSLDQAGAGASHQHPGSVSGNQGNRSPGPQQPTHFPPHRQRSSQVCHQQTQVKSDGSPPVPLQAVPPAQLQQPQHHRLQDPVLPEPNSGCAQQGSSSPNRMVPSTGDLQHDHSMERPSGSGSNGHNLQQKSGSICLPPTTSSSRGSGCEISGLEQMGASVCLPPKKFITQLLPKLHSYKHHGVFIAPWQPTAPWFPALFQRAEGHLHLRTHLEQSVRSERVLSGYLSYERWTAFTF